jgi:hypothetical protein
MQLSNDRNLWGLPQNLKVVDLRYTRKNFIAHARPPIFKIPSTARIAEN